MDDTEITIENSAYAKIFMHALKNSYDDVENYYKNKEEKIIGYYHINADDSKNNDIKNIKICELISDKLIKNYKNALICLVQISKLNNSDDNCLNIYLKNDTSEWKKIHINISSENKEFLKKNISNNGYLNICDFDDHLNCINYDFMNPNLFKKV